MTVQVTGNCDRIYKKPVRFCKFPFLLYTGNNQHVRYLKKKKDKLKSSNKPEGKRPFVTNLLLIYVKYIIFVEKLYVIMVEIIKAEYFAIIFYMATLVKYQQLLFDITIRE